MGGQTVSNGTDFRYQNDGREPRARPSPVGHGVCEARSMRRRGRPLHPRHSFALHPHPAPSKQPTTPTCRRHIGHRKNVRRPPWQLVLGTRSSSTVQR
jgi:hypothetical protein